MFEITYNDSDTLQNFIDADKAYHGAIYDFTFEGRFIVYHFFVKDTARYVALDSMTGYGSEITRRRKDNLFDTRTYHSMTPMVLDSIKYTGDKRYLNVIVNNPLEAIDPSSARSFPSMDSPFVRIRSNSARTCTLGSPENRSPSAKRKSAPAKRLLI